MGKTLFIAEKPSVAQEFAKALDLTFRKRDGFMESENTIVTWCVGHLVTMAYPDAYDEKYKKWSLSTIPFIPETFRYQVIDSVQKQFKIVAGLLTSDEVDTIYICTDSGREGEYIYRLVAQQAGVRDKKQLRVWIDSQTREEIRRGIREAKDDSEYNNLGAAAYLRAKEDYLMGINFSRAMTLRYGNGIKNFLHEDKCVIAVGRVMTCVLGIVVRREREIRSFVKTPFYRVLGTFGDPSFEAEWQAQEGSAFFASPKLYLDKGFAKEEYARELIEYLKTQSSPVVESVSKKKETQNPPLLYNLAELQNDCSRFFKISPDQTLAAAQELYEKKLTTYPRTDARVLSSAVAKEIGTNLKGLSSSQTYRPYIEKIHSSESWRKIGKTRYTDDSAITDHYAIIPTGQGLNTLSSLSPVTAKVYDLIVRRFLAVFYPPAVFDKISLKIAVGTEHFSTSLKVCREKGWLEVKKNGDKEEGNDQSGIGSEKLAAYLSSMRRGTALSCSGYSIRQGETTPPKRYNSGSIILTMENAGQFIEEEELREQIKGSGIGTSATRAEILSKLVRNRYLALNKKTQIITPTQLGEMIYDTVGCCLKPLLDPKLTASWEKGLTGVSNGSVTQEEYLTKLTDFITRRTNYVKETDYSAMLTQVYGACAQNYPVKTVHPSGNGHSASKRRTKS